MNAADVLEISYLAVAVAAIVFLFRFGKIPRIYLTNYMRGLRFVKGSFVDVLGPGAYKPLTRRVQIEVVDMRPVPFVLESVGFRDALQSDSVISIGAELLVDDPYLAATSLKNRVADSIPVVRHTLRSLVSRTIADRTPEFRAKVAEDIQKAVSDELRCSGMKIANVEITEILSRSATPQRMGRGLN